MGRGTTCHGNEHTFARASGQHTPCGFCARKSGNLCRPRCTFSPLPRDAGVKSLRKHHQHVCGSINRSQLQQLRCPPCRFSCVHALRHRKQWLKCVHSGTGDLQGWKTSYHRPLEFAIGDDADASPAASSANMLRGFTSDHAAMASRQRDPNRPARRRTSAPVVVRWTSGASLMRRAREHAKWTVRVSTCRIGRNGPRRYQHE